MAALDDLRERLAGLGGQSGLRAKLKAREGQPGYAANIAAIEAEITRAEAQSFTYRDRTTGKFVSAAYALTHPNTTYRVEATNAD